MKKVRLEDYYADISFCVEVSEEEFLLLSKNRSKHYPVVEARNFDIETMTLYNELFKRPRFIESTPVDLIVDLY